jgi:transposase-like protein
VTNDCSPIAFVIGPTGDVLTEADLPPRNTARWVPRRKAEIIAAVNGGLLSLMDACQRYQISHEEFRDWVRAYEQCGLSGLRARRKRRQSEAEPSSGAQLYGV